MHLVLADGVEMSSLAPSDHPLKQDWGPVGIFPVESGSSLDCPHRATPGMRDGFLEGVG